MDNKDRPIHIEYEDYSDESASTSATNYQSLSLANFSWKSSTRITDYRLDFRNGAAMLARMFKIPRVPPEFASGHWGI